MFEAPPLLETPWNGTRHCLRTRQNGKVINIVINATPKPAAIPRPASASILGLSALHGCSIFDDQN